MKAFVTGRSSSDSHGLMEGKLWIDYEEDRVIVSIAIWCIYDRHLMISYEDHNDQIIISVIIGLHIFCPLRAITGGWVNRT